MAIPISTTWNLADFNATNIASLLGLGPSDLSVTPSIAPYLSYDAARNTIVVRGADRIAAQADFNVVLPSRFTLECTLRFPEMPHDVGDLADVAVGFSLADDASRGVSIYFAGTGIAVSRIDDFGSVTSLPDTSQYTAEVNAFFHTVRIAVDGPGSRAYVHVGRETDPNPALLYIVPVEATPTGLGDLFRLFVRGTEAQPASIEIKALRLASDLVMTNFPPTANAGSDRVVAVGEAARLDGRASFDVEGAALSYRWRVVDVPYRSTFAFEGSQGNTVDDGDADGVTDRFSVPVGTLPTWVAEGTVLVVQGVRYDVLSADNSTGTIIIRGESLPDSLVDAPFRLIRQSVLVGADTETPYLLGDISGLYRVELVVNDGEADSEPSEVLVSVVASRAPLGVEPQVEFIWDGLGDEWKYIENREVFTELWRGTAQLLAGKLLEAWQYHYNFSIQNAQGTFQKKWVAYRTLIAETSPDTVSISARYGHHVCTHDFAASAPAIVGTTLVIHYYSGDTPTSIGTATTTFTTTDLTVSLAELNTALLGTGITAYVRTAGPKQLLALRSSTRAFLLDSTSTAAALLGATTDAWNYLRGGFGARVTDRVYRVEDGIDLVVQGVSRGDLLVLNNGQSFRIDRVLNDPSDPGPNQRVLLFDALPFDASPEWEIPSTVVSTAIDYEIEGVYPGDLLKGEVYDTNTSTDIDIRGVVVAQKGGTLAVNLDDFYGAVLSTDFETRVLGVKRRKAIPIPDDIKSIPVLQDKIPVSASPLYWKENVDYYLEPFYREVDGSAIPMLQFHDTTFIVPDLEPPDIFWAELTLFSNDQNIENFFGRLVGFTRGDASTFGSDFSYRSGVAGLLYSQQRGPTPYAMRVGSQILLGQPFAEVTGIVKEIRSDYTPTTGRILLQDYDGYDPPRTEIVRSYVYRKDPLDLSETSGLEINPATGAPYTVGDRIEQFAPIGTGVAIRDYVNDPTWFVPFVRSGVMTELQKFFRFALTFNLDLVSLVNLQLVYQFIYRVKPTYSYPMLLGLRNHVDDVDPQEVLGMTLVHHEYDSVCGTGRVHMYDDYRGDGTIWSTFDDGVTRFDGLTDCPTDYIEFFFRLNWPGGVITYDSVFFADVLITDVSGAYTGTPGSTFLPTLDLNLPAGTYTLTAVVDSGSTF